MKLVLKSLNLKQKGWFSWIFSKSFTIRINNRPLKLQVGFFNLYYIINLKNTDVNITIDVDHVIYDFSKTFTKGNNTININLPCFNGQMNFTLIETNLFLFLNNTTFISKTLQDNNDLFAVRLGYDNNEYYVNRQTYLTSYNNQLSNLTLPGWETIFYNNKLLYVNHNIKLTYWASPSHINSLLRNKINDWEDLVSRMTTYSLRGYVNLKLHVVRNHIIDSSGIFLLRNIDKLKHKKLIVIFENEMGQDYGALLREFIYETSLEFLSDSRLQKSEYVDVGNSNCNSDYLYLSVQDIGYRNQIQTDFDKVQPNTNRMTDESFFTYLGVFLALCINFNEQIDYKFSLAFFDNLLKRKFDIRYIQDVEYQRNILKVLRSNDPLETYLLDDVVTAEDQELNPSNDQELNLDIQYFDSTIHQEAHLIKNQEINTNIQNSNLCNDLEINSNVQNLHLTNQNKNSTKQNLHLTKEQQIKQIVHDKLNKKTPYEFIRKGFYSIIAENFQDIFDPDDLYFLLTNDQKLSVSILKEFTIYNMCNDQSLEVIWLWDILDKKDEIFLRKFLKFVTGSGTVPMVLNNFNYKIVIEKNNVKDGLFRASACLNKLFIGCYQNKEKMESILEFCVLNTDGFHKV